MRKLWRCVRAALMAGMPGAREISTIICLGHSRVFEQICTIIIVIEVNFRSGKVDYQFNASILAKIPKKYAEKLSIVAGIERFIDRDQRKYDKTDKTNWSKRNKLKESIGKNKQLIKIKKLELENLIGPRIQELERNLEDKEDAALRSELIVLSEVHTALVKDPTYQYRAAVEKAGEATLSNREILELWADSEKQLLDVTRCFHNAKRVIAKKNDLLITLINLENYLDENNYYPSGDFRKRCDALEDRIGNDHSFVQLFDKILDTIVRNYFAETLAATSDFKVTRAEVYVMRATLKEIRRAKTEFDKPDIDGVRIKALQDVAEAVKLKQSAKALEGRVRRRKVKSKDKKQKEPIRPKQDRIISRH